MKIVTRKAAGGDPVPEGTYVFTLQELRGPDARDFTKDDGEEVHIDQSFLAIAKVAQGPSTGRVAMARFDVDGDFGWAFTTLAQACTGKRYDEGDPIETDQMVGRQFTATVQHRAGNDGRVYTDLRKIVPVAGTRPVATTAPKARASLAKAAKKSR